MEFKPKPKTAAPQAQTAAQPSAWQPSTPELQPISKTGPWRRSMGLKFPDARETAQPEAGAEMEAAAKVAGNTAAPAAAKPVAAKPVFTKLTDQQVKDAQAWYAAKKEQYTPDVVKQIQKKLGIAQTGKADVATIQAVAKWQAVNKPLPIDGEQGKFTVNGQADATLLEHMFPDPFISKNAVNSYIKDFKNLAQKWPSLSRDERLRNLSNIINRRLSESGVPEVQIVAHAFANKTNAQFIRGTWQFYVKDSLIDEKSLSVDEAAKLADTIFHEAKHAVQEFDAARLQAGNKISTENISNKAIPSSVAKKAAARPISPSSIAGIKADSFYQSIYGSGAENRNLTINILNQMGNYLNSLEEEIRILNSQVVKYASIINKANNVETSKKYMPLYEKSLKELQSKEKELADDTPLYNQQWRKYANLPEEADAWRAGGVISEAYKK